MTDTSNIIPAGSSLNITEALKAAQEATRVICDVDSIVYLKMSKAGQWHWGADANEVSENSEWVIDPQSYLLGYICWSSPDPKMRNKKAELLGEEFAFVLRGEELPPVGDLPKFDTGTGGEWTSQNGFILNCIKSDDAAEVGISALFKTSSTGGRREVTKILDAIIANDAAGQPSAPVVKLSHSTYKHSAWGEVFTPKLEIVDWMDQTLATPAENKALLTDSTTNQHTEKAKAPARQRVRKE